MSSHLKGILLIILGTVSWGASGVISQYLFTHKNFLPLDILPIRCLFSGLILLAIDAYVYRGRDNIFSIWWTKDRWALMVFGLIGMVGIQYTFFQTILYSNAATATILQYLMPIVILLYILFSTKKIPRTLDIISISLAMIGTFILITKGDFTTLSITPVALFWGLSSACLAAFYTLQPRDIIRRWRSTLVIGWGMFIGGIALTIWNPFWHTTAIYDFNSIMAVAAIVIVGTAIAFYGYLESTKYLTPTEISVFACLEPFSSIVLSIIFLNVSFGLYELIGSIIIIISVTMLSR